MAKCENKDRRFESVNKKKVKIFDKELLQYQEVIFGLE
jgi:hypothetical protein